MPLLKLQPQQNEPAEYTQRSPNVLKNILQKHFQSFSKKYTEKYDTEYRNLRLERIWFFKDGFLSCGDYTKEIERIQCTNPDCKHEIFLPFYCNRFYFCPSCDAHGGAIAGGYTDGHEPASQKMPILFGEHISN